MSPSPFPELFPLHGRTVLVVEDSPVQRLLAVGLAAKLGSTLVLEATNGLEALALLAQVPSIDLVLTDLEMPVMDGISFIGEFAARGFRPELVLVSAQEPALLHSVRIMSETYGLKVPGIIPKPLTIEGLRSLLAPKPLLAPSPPGQLPAPPDESGLDGIGLDDIAAGIRAGAFTCYFQPQVAMADAALTGVEALVRWRNPQVGLLGPAAFLRKAESDEGVMYDLTMAILAAVAKPWQEWIRKGLGLDLAVNLSARSIASPGFSELFMAAAEGLDLPPASMVLELTESASCSNLGSSLENLARLRLRGFRLSIDDVGTGFSIFRPLERIPFTELKIDHSITGGLPATERQLVLARSILHMAKGLDLSTVAEGVETLDAWTALRALGCERAQGYLIARPMAGEQLLAWAAVDRGHLNG